MSIQMPSSMAAAIKVIKVNDAFFRLLLFINSFSMISGIVSFEKGLKML